ncbi:MAG: hypothetical protein H7A38_03895 [Chlamydiales bacterium]|nr:hypothetical protein [Chlamydiales bacterium]
MSGPTVVSTSPLETIPTPILQRTDCCSALMVLILDVTHVLKKEGSVTEAQKADYLAQKEWLISHIPPEQICRGCQAALRSIPTPTDSTKITPTCEWIQ